uniref:BPTI/Kunitz inhibitor domain-containing protein n=1 Tax=Globodera pallida TaxID=36090 RepID=A0A183C5U2_GLOPA
MWVFEELVGDRKLSEIINEQHENVKYLPGKKLPANVLAVTDVVEAAKDADILIFVVPHQHVHRLCAQLKGNIKPCAIAISLIKGLATCHDGSVGLKLISEEIKQSLGIETAVLMGANLANEVAEDRFCEATIGTKNASRGNELKKLFHTDNFRINVVEDAETCGRCHFQLSRYYRDAKNFVFRPICDAKTGNYQPQQCRDEKHCFCVNVISGVRLSKKEVPSGDNLQCEGSEFDFSIDDSHLIKTEKGEGGKANEQLIPLGSPICKKPKDAGKKCHAGVAAGPIAAKNIKWYFDTDTFECLAFAYSGCGGNGNRFDSPAECWEKCKLADLSGCAGMRLPATNKQGHTIICAGPGQQTPGACPSSYRCTMLAHMGVCCHSATQDLYECNYRPTCPNGGQAMQMHSRGVPMTLIGKKCADNFCPIGAKCVEKEIFAHCC